MTCCSRRQADRAVIFTRKERELLSLISEGYISSGIAEKMHLGFDSINNNYRKNLLLKLDARKMFSQIYLCANEN